MAVSDDNFIREVNEDLRQEKLQNAWRKLKPFIIGGAVAIILIAIGVEVNSYYQNRQSQKYGSLYTEALTLANAGPSNDAFEKLAALEKNGTGGYPMLARFRAASLLVQKNDKDAAVKAFQSLANDKKLPNAWREMASIRAAYLLVDNGSFTDVEKQIKQQATDVSPMRFAAREALGLAAWKAGDLQQAAYYFNHNYSDTGSAGLGFADRAAMMLSLISSESGKQVADVDQVDKSPADTTVNAVPNSAAQ